MVIISFSDGAAYLLPAVEAGRPSGHGDAAAVQHLELDHGGSIGRLRMVVGE